MVAKIHETTGFPCLHCGKTKTVVVETRRSVAKDPDRLRRRRKCRYCGTRFTTFEMATIDDAIGRAASRIEEVIRVLSPVERRWLIGTVEMLAAMHQVDGPARLDVDMDWIRSLIRG